MSIRTFIDKFRPKRLGKVTIPTRFGVYTLVSDSEYDYYVDLLQKFTDGRYDIIYVHQHSPETTGKCSRCKNLREINKTRYKYLSYSESNNAYSLLSRVRLFS
jgi:hypothetical protein